MTTTQEALKMAIEDALKFVTTLNQYEDAIHAKPFKTEADKYLSYASVVIKSLATSLQEALKPHPDCDEACMYQCQMERKEALEQQEQEPVAVCVVMPLRENDARRRFDIVWKKGQPIEGKLYTHPAKQLSDGCGKCHACLVGVNDESGLPVTATRMILCPTCGNKRCPHASNHRYACTNSNEPNQNGSVYRS